MSRVCISLFFLVCTACVNIAAQATALTTFESIDGIFRFVYPQTYDLLVGERIFKATQAKNSETICDFATAIACVIYPFERPGQTRLEAGAFSVGRVPDAKDESQCLSFADRPSRTKTSPVQSVTINHHEFRFQSRQTARLGHLEMADYYRTFRHGDCYELTIEVLLLQASLPNQPGPLDEQAASARESLELILSSFTFE